MRRQLTGLSQGLSPLRAPRDRYHHSCFTDKDMGEVQKGQIPCPKSWDYKRQNPHVFLIPKTNIFSTTPRFLANYPSQVRTSLRISLQSSLSSILVFITLPPGGKHPQLSTQAKLGKIHMRDINLSFTRARKIPVGEILEMAQRDKDWEFRKKS